MAHQLVGEVGTDAMSGVFDAAARHLDTYPAQTDDDPMPVIADWRVLLDLLEDVAGSTQTEQVFRDLVVGEADLALLDERTTSPCRDGRPADGRARHRGPHARRTGARHPRGCPQ